MRGVGFQEAVALLGDVRSISPTSNPTHTLTDQKSNIEVLKPYKGSYEKFKVECEWLTKRIPDKAVLDRYGVFCYRNDSRKSAYNNRVLLPVKSPQGELIGYLGRAIPPSSGQSQQTSPEASGSDVPKYLFAKGLEKSRFLFGAHELSTFGKAPLKYVYLLESPFAVLHYASLNLAAVASYGWSVSPEQIQLLQQITKGVIYIPDTNKREEAARSSLSHLASCIWVMLPQLPDGIDDPEHLTKEQIQALTH